MKDNLKYFFLINPSECVFSVIITFIVHLFYFLQRD